MTIQETAAVFQILQGAYPSWKPNRDTLLAWSALFVDEPPEIVVAGVKAFIASDTKGFAPTIGQIKSIIHTPPDQLTESEAWALVYKAIQNGIYGCCGIRKASAAGPKGSRRSDADQCLGTATGWREHGGGVEFYEELPDHA